MTLSIITINKNNAAGLKKTIESVVLQTYIDFEYIIIDGASNDGSIDIIRTYEDNITYWVSEPDTGIYNAMNKGIRQAQGDYCLFLNSGDCLVESETLQNVFNEIAEIGAADIYYSDMEKTDGTVRYHNKKLSISNLVLTPLSHQNSLIKRSLFIQHGYYNENLKIASDWEFFLQEMYVYHVTYIYITTHIARFDTNGIGSQGSIDQFNEEKIAFINVFGDLGESLFKFRCYSKGIYSTIIDTYGSSEILDFLLKSYRYCIKRFRRILRKG